jgi:hypothetical protein
MLLWLVIGFIVWKMIRLAASHANRPKDQEEAPFAHIEEAEYEDMSKPPPEPPPGPNEKN